VDRLKERLQTAEQAILQLEGSLTIENPSQLERDGTIQRFEFAFEALWKAAKEYLYTIEGLDVASPKGVIRSSRELGILDERNATLALLMADDRNLTVHTYNEALAIEIYTRIKQHTVLMRSWQNKIVRLSLSKLQ